MHVHRGTCSAPGGIQQDLMHPAHADIDRVQNHADCFIHQSPQAKLWRHQVSLVPICFPDNLQNTNTMSCSHALMG